MTSDTELAEYARIVQNGLQNAHLLLVNAVGFVVVT
jgi:hypothetical protein